MRVVIVGAGISGLVCAWQVLRAARERGEAAEVALVEASDRAGGNLVTEHAGGFLVEAGADSWVASKPHATELCRELGLGERLVETLPANRRLYVVHRGALAPVPAGLVLGVPTSARALLASPVLSLRGKVRALAEVAFAWDRRGDADVSLGKLMRRRFGSELFDVVLEPLLGGVHAGDVRELSLAAAFPQLAEMRARSGSFVLHARRAARAARSARAATGGSGGPPSAFLSLRGGVGELVDALVREVGPALRTRAPVRGVERDGGQLAVRLEDGTALRADHVVVATQASAAARLLAGLDAALASELAAIPYGSAATVTLAFPRSAVRHPLDAAGFLVPKSERRRVMAGTFISSKWPDRAPEGTALLRVFVGGRASEPEVNDDAALVALARAELGELVGATGEPLLARVFRWVRASPQPVVGHPARVRRIRDRAAAIPGLALIGNAYDGAGIPDCVRMGRRAGRGVFA